jgi:hypothetical protein
LPNEPPTTTPEASHRIATHNVRNLASATALDDAAQTAEEDAHLTHVREEVHVFMRKFPPPF